MNKSAVLKGTGTSSSRECHSYRKPVTHWLQSSLAIFLPLWGRYMWITFQAVRNERHRFISPLQMSNQACGGKKQMFPSTFLKLPPWFHFFKPWLTHVALAYLGEQSASVESRGNSTEAENNCGAMNRPRNSPVHFSFCHLPVLCPQAHFVTSSELWALVSLASKTELVVTVHTVVPPCDEGTMVLNVCSPLWLIYWTHWW